MAKHIHRRNNSSFPSAPESEDIEGQIDRLNQALQIVMQEIECNTHSSRVPSRLSAANSEFYLENEPDSPSYKSDDVHLPRDFEERIEELLQTIDRDKMIIEDYRSNELRNIITTNPTENEKKFDYDLAKIRTEIELSLKMQKNLALEKEKKNFEEKLEELDLLKEEYLTKKKEIISGIDKLNIKEKLLDQKEKDLRTSRMAFDRHRLLWEQDHQMPKLKENLPSKTNELKPPLVVDHNRNESLSSINPLRSSLPVNFGFKSMLTQKLEAKTERSGEVKIDGAPPTRFSSLESCQEELKILEHELTKASSINGSDVSNLELKIDQLKNKIAAVRGEKVMLESAQATKLMSTIMMSIQKQTNKDDLMSKRTQLLERMNKKSSEANNIVVNQAEIFKIKQLEQKAPENSETTRRFLFSDAPTPRGIHTPRTVEKEDPYRAYFEGKKKMLIEKEKELNQREFMLQETWMKLPGARELIDNVNLTLSKLNAEKASMENQRDEFEKERLEFFKIKEKFMAQVKREEKKITN